MAVSTSRRRRGPRTVLIVDDSELMRALLRSLVEGMHGFVVAGEAATGYQAIRLVHELDPDVTTLDLQMPDLGGAETLDYIMSESARPVILVSAHSEQLVEPALSAILHGAIDFVGKPAAGSGAELGDFARRFRQAVRAAAMARVAAPATRAVRTSPAHDEVHARARCAVAVAASTGGPRALAEVLPRLSASLPAAVFVAQHMPPFFTAALARRLHAASALSVKEAEDGEVADTGTVYVAPGGRHLELERTRRGVVVKLTDSAPVWGVRPAADVLFRSVARTFGPASVGLVLTGMGRDGAEGMRALREVGGTTLCQDPATSVIASMPKAASRYADVVVALDEIHQAVTDAVAGAALRKK